MSGVRPALLAAALLFPSLPAAAQQPVTTEVRDSAGVTIVTNRGDAPPERWTLSGPEVTLRLAPEDTAMQIVGAARVSGGFVVASGDARQLRWYDTAGAYIRGAGRPGTAPGEFEYLSWIAPLPGDSIAAWDSGTDRLSIFSPARRFVRAVTFPGLQGIFLPDGLLPDGSLVVSRIEIKAPAGARAGQVVRTPRALVRADAAGSAELVATVPDAERHARLLPGDEPGDDLYLLYLPLGRSTYVRTAGDAVFVATGERYEIARYGADGRLQRLVRRDADPLPVRPADRDDITRMLLEWMGDAPDEVKREEAAHLKAAPVPATHPPYLWMTVDDGGRLWVQETDPPSRWDHGTRWSVFDAEGRWIAAVQAPAYFQPLHFGPDWVLAREAEGVRGSVVRLRRIHRAPRD